MGSSRRLQSGLMKFSPPVAKKTSRGEEYGKAHAGLVVCKRCQNLFFKKAWHHPDSVVLKNALRKGIPVKLALCPACTMIVGRLFEGEVLIENVPKRFSAELLHLIANFGARAQKRDPQDRIIGIEEFSIGFRVTTTENQLAAKLGKKIKDVFKKVDLSIVHSREPYETDRVRAIFQP